MKLTKTVFWTSAGLIGLALVMTAPASADILHLDDVIIDGSLCVGFDCVNGESFGFDTIRIKENNLRIKAQDTSSTASFPTNDWQITFNDSSNGGANKFAIDDIDGGRTPFTIEAGAPSNSLFVENSGELGLGTNNPVVNLHVVDGNTPTLRLEQDGSSGFTPQTWDVAGNEANFFIRDTTNGSDLPFRIFPNAGTNALVIEGSTGDIGIGTNAPSASMHLRRTDATALVLVEEASGTTVERTLMNLKNNGNVRLQLTNTAGDIWQLINRSGGMAFSIPGSGQAEVFFSSAGDIEAHGTITGSVGSPSSREFKHSLTTLDYEQVLEKVEALPLFAWTYKPQISSDQTRHFGPVAEDFYSSFGLGADNRIAPTDSSGIALAAIKALNQKVVDLEAERGDLQESLSELRSMVEVLIEMGSEAR